MMQIARFLALRIGLIFILLAHLSSCATLSTVSHPRVGLQLIADGFASPVVLVAPDDQSGRLFVVDQIGIIWIVAGGQRLTEPFLDIRDRLADLSEFYDERGLLGLAFHPNFAQNGRFFVYYSAPLRAGLSPEEWDHTTHLSEFRASADDPDRADATSERVILAIDKPGYNYEAGHIAFGPDGDLYIALGDSARHPDREVSGEAQDTSNLLGKILRIDVDHGDPYGFPPDNPFISGGGRPEIFAYGFRNPYRFSFDSRGEYALLTGDVGHAVMEEVDVVRRGGNYGWPLREGTTCFNSSNWTQPLATCMKAGTNGEKLIDPVLSYRHSENLSAVIGGLIYRGSVLTDLAGDYIFGDWGRGQGRLFAAQPAESSGVPWKVQDIDIAYRADQPQLGQLLGFGQDGNGEVYLLVKDPRSGPTGASGRVYKLIRP